jgi:hypothetical protein
MRRCSTPVAMLGALLAIGFGTQPTCTRAATINPNASITTADYRLTTSTAIPVPDPNISGPQVVAAILPPGTVVPPTLSDGTQGSPLTVLSDSHGFDASKLVVALKDGTSSTGQAQQMFGLVFIGQGLQPGGVLHFALSIDKSLASNPPQLVSQTPGVTITPDAVPVTSTTGSGGNNSGGGGGGGTETTIPEPFSLVVWSAVVTGVIARRRLLKRSRPA